MARMLGAVRDRPLDAAEVDALATVGIRQLMATWRVRQPTITCTSCECAAWHTPVDRLRCRHATIAWGGAHSNPVRGRPDPCAIGVAL